jgi:hypothetical protein
MSDADRIQARIDKLEQNPNTNTAPGSELSELYRQLSLSNTVDNNDYVQSLQSNQEDV